eukprot:jgi/Mesvir1/12087/Mv00363-RA.1
MPLIIKTSKHAPSCNCGEPRCGSALPTSPNTPSKKEILETKRKLEPFLKALRFVESSNNPNTPDGDGGTSIGPFQISDAYHCDAWNIACERSYTKCRDKQYAENTVVSYLLKYNREAIEKGDYESLAKTHNGGPHGPSYAKTQDYWRKVSEYMRNPIPSWYDTQQGSPKRNLTQDLGRLAIATAVVAGAARLASPKKGGGTPRSPFSPSSLGPSSPSVLP